jgi:hypothetical protein
VSNTIVVLFDPVDHVAGRWAVRRTTWHGFGCSGPLWAAAGYDGTPGRPYTALFAPGADGARDARRFAQIAATRGVRSANRALGLRDELAGRYEP